MPQRKHLRCKEAPAPSEEAVPPPVVLTKAKRWLVALICAGIVCALLIGIAALMGVYSINQRLEPDNIVPAEEIEREKVDQSQIIAPGTLQPLQP